jgi:hypothetical protein
MPIIAVPAAMIVKSEFFSLLRYFEVMNEGASYNYSFPATITSKGDFSLAGTKSLSR